MTAREAIELVRKNLGIPFNENTYRDTFKIGNPDTEVKGIATTVMTTFDMIKRTHEAGLNLIITHEDTFWNDRDETKDLLTNPLYKLKTEYCLKNDIIIWRFHDHQHAKKPDQSIVASLRSVGIEDENATMGSGKVYTIPETTLGAFASQIKKRTGSRAFRVVGDPNAKISRILLGPGYASPRMTAEADVVIGGESPETDGAFDNPEYVMDAATLGIAKGQIILGHVVSEEPGMEECAKWLRTFIGGVPIQFVPAGEPYWT
ncbi:MAG TPA: Nif3-like dinuclear metal center hexameric protein [Bryobacteraceae bacterium]|nr:Nif3-like dinuclear metal center hexameric protein [Bryobacteraceae bacterium]